jgi:hypothetical protein
MGIQTDIMKSRSLVLLVVILLVIIGGVFLVGRAGAKS